MSKFRGRLTQANGAAFLFLNLGLDTNERVVYTDSFVS